MSNALAYVPLPSSTSASDSSLTTQSPHGPRWTTRMRSRQCHPVTIVAMFIIAVSVMALATLPPNVSLSQLPGGLSLSTGHLQVTGDMSQAPEVGSAAPRLEADQAIDQARSEPLECSDSVAIEAVSNPKFWLVRQLSPLMYTVSPRSSRINFPAVCLSAAIFSARLVQESEALMSDPESRGVETLRWLGRPTLDRATLATHNLMIPQSLVIPRSHYRLEIFLEFGYLAGGREGQVCGDSKLACDHIALGQKFGDTAHYSGEVIDFEPGASGQVMLGQELFSTNDATAPLCAIFSPLQGYWKDLSYHAVANATHCRLADFDFPLPVWPTMDHTQDHVEAGESVEVYPAPVWLHFVGDSNTRNLFVTLAKALGTGPYVNAQVMDSREKNGTVATIALRSRTGEQSYGRDAAVPDLILTWAWWHQRSPGRSTKTAEAYDDQLDLERAALNSLADTTLAAFARRFRFSPTLAGTASVAEPGHKTLNELARSLMPHRTYLSLGSHSEALTRRGQEYSLDSLFDEFKPGALSRATRDRIGMRVFTTTRVDVRGIPTDQFPRQELVRNNAVIEARNDVLRAHFIDEPGQVIDVEGLTAGITESKDGRWMKQRTNAAGQIVVDAVHFRDEVYQEWSRLVWTELVVAWQAEQEVDEQDHDEW